MRIVLDTNVFVAALLGGGGGSRQVLRRCLEGQYVPLMGVSLLCEHRDLMDRADLWARCVLPQDERLEILRAFLRICVPIETYYKWRPNLIDEGDNHVMELAIAGNAQMIVTHNIRDFQHGELAFPNIEILAPGELLRRNQ